ncbi:GNAT family N-acetyltransferase [Tropicibacter sp. R16_0]|uniref:GNAT family N-acetyltransferase n=1 Tax=Tropicibacter sp. R16_0 TaxID=2821102 RepID=UPI001ADB8B61|nr:GNAT family N-acetyltransferase [Tropicibacter sp. R16_0]MBO9449488.1 GNAT family N-acetyltransferase [Tropicibacter sp. R16_0]
MTVLRPAQPEDVAAIETCLTAAYAKARAELSDLPDVTGGIAAEIAENLVFVAEDDTSVVGVIVLVVRDDVLLIANLGVDPAHSGQGVGGRLLDLADREARKRRCRELRLRTHAGLTATRAMYLHLGWSEIAQSGKVISMRKRL